MKKSIFGRLTTIVFCAAFLTMAFTIQIMAQSGESGNPKVSSRSVVIMATGVKVPSAGSSLSRNSNGVYFTFDTTGLTNGNVYTLWMAVFNNPRACATSPCTPADFTNPDVDGTLLNTGGKIVGADGTAGYGAYREVGDTTGARPNTGTGNGIVDPLRAEIHLVIRSHGPAILADPMVLAQQLTMFNGGCPPNTCMNLHASVHQR